MIVQYYVLIKIVKEQQVNVLIVLEDIIKMEIMIVKNVQLDIIHQVV